MRLFFTQEASLLSRLNHPNVVRFFGVSYEEGHFYIVTEYCPSNLHKVKLRPKRTTALEMVAQAVLCLLASRHCGFLVCTLLALRQANSFMSLPVWSLGLPTCAFYAC